VKVIEEHFAGCGFPLVAEGVRAKWRPTASDLEACRALGRKAGEAAQAAD
jgi:flavorubredoxin